MLAPGSRIGILGGGQLGRMLAMAAARLGFDVSIFDNAEDSPASRVASETMVGDFADTCALSDFAAHVDAVTTEFENIPAEALEALAAAGVIVRPSAAALATAQDRISEKVFFQSVGVPTTAFAAVNEPSELSAAVAAIGTPSILKLRRFGYDGKGQVRLSEAAAATPALESLGGPAILEAFAPFEREVSVVAARGADGAFAAYDVCENEHRDGILRLTRAPARIAPEIAAEAIAAARRIGEGLDYVGVYCVEFFLMPDGRLLANEMAPRVHNTGHWTEAAAATSQFEQHIRAVAGWPLGSTARLFDAEMENLIGAEVARWRALSADSEAVLHLYGKRSVRDGRKMGHVTRRVR